MAITRTFSGFGTQDGSDFVIVGSVGTPVAGEMLVLFVAMSDTTKSVSSWSDDSSGGTMTYTFLTSVSVTGLRLEAWLVNSAHAGFTFVRANMSGNTPASLTLVEMAGVANTGTSATDNNTTADPTITITTEDANNFLIAGFGSVGATLATAKTGNLDRSKNSTGVNPVVCSLVDNTVAGAGSLTGAVTLAAAQWAAIGIELRSVIGGGATLASRGLLGVGV